ncbi:MAG: hypothetical protein ABEK12_01465, partial [Candidatus Nanohaloarchaea archaeon]
RGVRDGDVVNHWADPVDVIEAAPPGVDLLFGPSEHLQTDPWFYQELQERVEADGGTVDIFDTHTYGELEDTRFAFWNGVEASVDGNDAHFGVYGIPPTEAATLYDHDSVPDLYDAVRGLDADLVVANHPYLPLFSTPDDVWEEFLEVAPDSDIPSAVEYSTGYSDLANLISRGVLADETVAETAQDNDLYLVPGLDAHDSLPPRFDGSGLLPASYMDDLSTSGVDAEEMLDDMQVVAHGRVAGQGDGPFPLKTVRGNLEFLRTYADVLPGWDGDGVLDRVYRAIDAPYTPADFQERWKASVDALDAPTPAELQDAAYDPLAVR